MTVLIQSCPGVRGAESDLEATWLPFHGPGYTNKARCKGIKELPVSRALCPCLPTPRSQPRLQLLIRPCHSPAWLNSSPAAGTCCYGNGLFGKLWDDGLCPQSQGWGLEEGAAVGCL